MKLEKKLKHALNSNNLDSIHQVFEEIYNNYKYVFKYGRQYLEHITFYLSFHSRNPII